MAVAIFRFGCRSTSGVVDKESFESGDPENLSIAVGTACLSVVEREIKLLPVWRSPSFVSAVVGRRRVSAMSPSSRAIPKTRV